MAQGRIRCLWCNRARSREREARRQLAQKARYVCGHPVNARYQFCRRHHPELVRVKGKVVWSGTHRFGVDWVFHQVQIRDARVSPRFKWTPADRLTSVTAQEAGRKRAVEVVDVVSTAWTHKSGPDKWGVWRKKGEAYQLVRYKIERRFMAWVPMAEADDQAVAS